MCRMVQAGSFSSVSLSQAAGSMPLRASEIVSLELVASAGVQESSFPLQGKYGRTCATVI